MEPEQESKTKGSTRKRSSASGFSIEKQEAAKGEAKDAAIPNSRDLDEVGVWKSFLKPDEKKVLMEANARLKHHHGTQARSQLSPAISHH